MVLAVDKLKQLLGIEAESTDKDFALEFILEDIENRVLDYCHIEEIPERLVNTCYRMAMDVYRNENVGSEESASTNIGIKSISEGDTTVSYGEVDGGKSTTNYMDSLLKNYVSQLNRYRKLVWK